MKKSIIVLSLLLCLVMKEVNAQKQSLLVDYELFNNFETGELYGWEPYPYAQDIGFDALYFARKSPTFKKSKYALSHPVKAFDTNELLQGFTRRLDMFTDDSTHVRLALYFQSDRNPEKIELSLGTDDGRRYFHTVSNPEANQWIELDVPVSEFKMDGKSLSANEHLQAITVKGMYPVVYYLYTYTLLMDDFKITGKRNLRFIAEQPVSTAFEMFGQTILNKHYLYGDTISLQVKPEVNISLVKVEGSLMNSSGIVIKSGISFSKSEKGWMNDNIYRITKKDLKGQWTLKLTGTGKNNSSVVSEFTFLVPGKPIVGHPRLFFSKDELQQRIKNDPSPVSKAILKKALDDSSYLKIDVESAVEGEDKTSENLVGGPYAKNTVGFDAYAIWHSPMATLGKVIHEAAFRYSFTGDKNAGERGKQALLKLSAFKKWNCDWMLDRKFWTYYPVGYTIKNVAYGYDMLYDLMNEDERKMVRSAIMEKGLKLFYRDMVEMNRMPSNLTNHIAVLVAGFGMAATAIYGDAPSIGNMEPIISGIMTKAKAFINNTYYKDGSYGEPKSGYMDMATKDIIEILATFERNFGVDYSTTTDVENFYKYPLYASDSSGMIQTYGDGGRSYHGFTQDHAWWFVHRTGNPYLYQYVKPYWEAGNGGYLSYIWYRDDIKPLSRENLPLSKTFEAQGMVMRSGWDNSSTIITNRTGPHSNHYHFDQGSFQIMTNGEELLTDPGIGTGGYYMNNEFQSYNIQAIAHNVLLVDHDPQSQVAADFDNGIKALTDWPRMKHGFTGAIADAVESELSSVYKGKLESYSRTLLYSKSGPLFLFDQVKSKSPDGHVYDWLFHAPRNEGKRSVSYVDGRISIDRPNARLTMDIISPDSLTGNIRDRNGNTNTYLNYNSKYFSESFVTLTSAPKLKFTNFLAVIIPEAKPATGDYGALPVTTKLSGEGWIGAKIERPGVTDYGFFRLNQNSTGKIDEFTTDAKKFIITERGDVIQKVYLEGSGFSGKGISIKATEVVACAIQFKEGPALVETMAEEPLELRINAAKKPTKLVLAGKVYWNWKYVDGSVIIEVPAGRTDWSFEY